jgi:hypothetical protein
VGGASNGFGAKEIKGLNVIYKNPRGICQLLEK